MADRLLDIDILAGHHGVDRRQCVPVIGRGNDDRVDVFAVKHVTEIARGLGRVALRFLDAIGRSRGVPVIDVSDGDELDLRLGQERVEELNAAAAGADEPEADLLVRGSGLADPREPRPRRRPGRYPTASTKLRR